VDTLFLTQQFRQRKHASVAHFSGPTLGWFDRIEGPFAIEAVPVDKGFVYLRLTDAGWVKVFAAVFGGQQSLGDGIFFSRPSLLPVVASGRFCPG
jgi:hypothetical protein